MIVAQPEIAKAVMPAKKTRFILLPEFGSDYFRFLTILVLQQYILFVYLTKVIGQASELDPHSGVTSRNCMPDSSVHGLVSSFEARKISEK
jgi:hypothetical protein